MLNASQGHKVTIKFEVRSGVCPDCGTPLDAVPKPPRADDKRFCPKCGDFKLGRLKKEGKKR